MGTLWEAKEVPTEPAQKKDLSMSIYVRMSFAPKMLEIGLPRLRMSQSFLQDISRAVSRFSRGLVGPVAGNHRQHFFGPTGSCERTTY